MCSILPEKTKNIEKNIRNYLTCSYDLGYNLDNYFTEPQQTKMFERLLSCDVSFNQDWKNGVYSIPENPEQTMYLSTYIKKQSAAKKLSRKITKYSNTSKKLSKGAKSLLEDYMRENTKDFIAEGKERNLDTRIEEMFCGIFTQIESRKQSYVEKKVPEDVANIIREYTEKKSAGTNRKHLKKTRKNVKN
jgi:hypothetical protein